MNTVGQTEFTKPLHGSQCCTQKKFGKFRLSFPISAGCFNASMYHEMEQNNLFISHILPSYLPSMTMTILAQHNRSRFTYTHAIAVRLINYSDNLSLNLRTYQQKRTTC